MTHFPARLRQAFVALQFAALIVFLISAVVVQIETSNIHFALKAVMAALHKWQ